MKTRDRFRNRLIQSSFLGLLVTAGNGVSDQAYAVNNDRERKIQEVRLKLPLINKEIENKPDSADLVAVRAIANYVVGNNEAAEADFKNAEAMHYSTKLFEFNSMRGTNLLLLKKFDLAITTLSKALELQPNSSVALTNRSSAYLELGKYENALRDSLKAVSLDSNSSAAQGTAGASYFNCAQYQKALSCLNKAIELEPKNFEALQYRGKTYEKLGKKDLAAKDFVAASALGYAPGKSFSEMKDWYSSEQESKSGISKTNLQALVSKIDRGQLLLREGKSVEAMREVIEGLKLSPKNSMLLTLKASIETYECQYRKAIQDSSLAISSKPDNSQAYATRGGAHLRLSQFDLARQDLQKAASLSDPVDYQSRLHEIDNLDFDLRNKVSAPDRRWALACTAFLFSQNHQGFNSLAGAELTEAFRNKQREKLLPNAWDVNDRKTLLAQLKILVHHGQNTRWQGMRKVSDSDQLLLAFKRDWNNPQDYDRAVELVKEHGPQFGERGILAWDYCRYLCLCRWGYQAGYLSESEAWQLMMPMAKRLQELYTSWEQMANEYLIGRDFWWHGKSLRESPNLLLIKQRLLKDPDSPWMQLPWKTAIESKSDDPTIYALIEQARSKDQPSVEADR
ncbi:MAG: DUF1266 domain-containing protein [Candidatus Obscuribacterales bacterium]